MGMFKSSCTKAPKMVSFAQNTPAMYLFSQQGLKNPTISWSLLVFSSPFACSRQNPPMVTSLAAVTNLATVISLLSAISNCSSRNSQICFTGAGAPSLVLSSAFSSLGVKNGHLPLSCISRYTIDCSCFSVAATFFFSLLGPFRFTRGTRDGHVHVSEPQAGCQMTYCRFVIPIVGLSFSCLAKFEISSKKTSSSTMSISANSYNPLKAWDTSAHAAASSDFRNLKFIYSSSRLGAAIRIRHPFPSAIRIKIAYTNCRAGGMLAYPGDFVNTTFVLDPNRELTFSCISFIAANSVSMASHIFFGVGSSPFSCSRSPAACR